MKKKVGIVGGGAAGMVAAVFAARNGAEVTILEGNDRLGKKILSTGNGKCNLGNMRLSTEDYYTGDTAFLKNRLEEFGTEDTIAFFNQLGLMLKQIGDGLYPVSEQASTVLDALRYEIKAKKIQVINGFHVEKVRRNQAKNKICVMQKENVLEFDSLVLACGGKAAPKTGSDGSGYELAKSIGHSLVPVVPALVQLKCKEEWFKSISGVRAKAGICVRGNDEKEYEENGEIQFTDYGISGIPVFQLSRVANYILRERKEIEFIIDFLPWMNKEGFAERLLAERSSIEDGRTLEEYFTGILNKKIMLLFLKICGLHPGDLVKSVKRDKLKKVYELCRDFKVTVVGSNSFDNAQVCAGGVPLHEVSEGMESGKMPGVFLAGELLDVDGKCGGYNLQWAWCSGAIAGTSAAK